jgi:hypothetical protein
MTSHTKNRRNNVKTKKRLQSLALDKTSETQLIADQATEPIFHCVECRKPILGTPHEFGGNGLACESCIRAYYNGYPESSIAEELRCRGYAALRIIKQQHSRRRKSTALRNNAMCDVCGGPHNAENCPDDI